MTQPIQEPTTPRAISRLTWGDNQLFRRPAPPPGGGPIVFRAEQWNNALTTGTSVDMEPLVFDLYSNPDTSIFLPGLDGSGDLETVELLQPGYIVANLLLRWEDFDAAVAGMIDDSELVWPPSGQENTRKMRAGSGDGFIYSVSLARHYPTIDWEEGHGGVQLPDFTMFAGQASGSAREVQGRFDIAYWPATVGEITT